jgi:hypothetical protein
VPCLFEDLGVIERVVPAVEQPGAPELSPAERGGVRGAGGHPSQEHLTFDHLLVLRGSGLVHPLAQQHPVCGR